MPPDPPLDEAADPDRLQLFIAELEAEGFTRVGTWRWEGPTRGSLLDGDHTDSSRMTVVIRPSWPYLPPLLEVPGIAAWHADQERLCIWQAEDNSQRWATLQGLYERIDDWADQAQAGFAIVENARNPEIYWEERGEAIAALVDLEELLAGDEADGQHGEFHFAEAISPDGRTAANVFELNAGPFNAMTRLPADITDFRLVRGRWLYRSTVVRPPRRLDEFLSLLTDNQRSRLQRDMRDRPLLMFGLIWRNQAGLVSTMLFRAMRDQDEPLLGLVILRPKGREPMLLRGGPDVAVLRSRSVAVVGIGAVGSHVTESLARSGVGKLRMIDYDRIWPVNLIRHAAPPGTPAGIEKTEAMRHALEQYPWVEVEIPSSDEMTVIWTADQMADVLSGADLTIDATGHAGLAELMSRHAARLGRAFISVALFRGGAVARVRRQCLDGDTLIVQRPHLDRYLQIPPLDEEAEYVGTEVGCLSRVHNAPPVAVVRAGGLAADVAIDLLTGRHDEPDEVVEVFRRGDPPFDRLGRIRPEEYPVTVDVSEAAQAAIRVASRNALPNETGGILVGCVIDGRPTIVDASEIPDPAATPKSYHLASGKTVEAVETARRRDPRLGYLGEWHSHPSVGDPSPLDTATMAANSADAGVEHPVLIVSYPQGSPEGQDLRVFATSPFRLKAASMVTTGGLPPPGAVETP